MSTSVVHMVCECKPREGDLYRSSPYCSDDWYPTDRFTAAGEDPYPTCFGCINYWREESNYYTCNSSIQLMRWKEDQEGASHEQS